MSGVMNWLREKLFTPAFEVVDALPARYEFTRFPSTYPRYLSVPMESGQRALYRYDGRRTPGDPGDLHFHDFTFIKYIKAGKSKQEGK